MKDDGKKKSRKEGVPVKKRPSETPSGSDPDRSRPGGHREPPARDSREEELAKARLRIAELEHTAAALEEAGQTLTEYEATLRAIMASAHNAVIMIDGRGRIRRWNAAATRMFGWSEAEVLDRDLHLLLAPERYHADYRAGIGGFYRSGEGSAVGKALEVSALRKDGAEIPVELSITAVRIRDQWHSVGILRDMTDQKRTEDVLRRKEERYRTIFENTGTATIIIGPDMTILLANSNFEKISGYSRREMEGRIPWTTFIDEADQEKMRQFHELRRKDPAGAPGSYECRFLNRKGESRDIFITVAMIPGTGESVASLMDITDRKKAETALVRSEQNYRNIMDSIQEAYYEVDLQGNFTFFNTMAWLALGYSEDELRSMNFHTYVDEETADTVFAAYNKVFMTGEPIQAFEFDAITSKGERIPVEASVSLRRDATGEVLGFKGVVRDVSLRKETEKALRELSLIDELTGLNNRRGFAMLATQQLKIADRFRQKALLVYADLDRMKWINDTLGHKEGDRALTDTAVILKSSFRASDVIARIGGDEFVGLAVESGETTGEVIISRLQEHLNALNIHESRRYKLSISLGIATYDPEDPCSLDELLDRADRLMYEQKQAKREAGMP